MELKPGYKQTEVGVIPEDWDVVDAFELDPFITSGSRGWAKYYSDRGALFVRMTNLSRESIYPDLSDQKLVDLPKVETEGLRTVLQDGDILISITADIGIIGYVNANFPKPAYINQHVACLRLPAKRADSLFQSYYLASHGSQRRFAELTDVGAKTGINLTTVGKLKLIRPPLPEQHAIANALSDADALLSRLELLIGKKRDLKQAAMQQLLTGLIRLPGYTGEWHVAAVHQMGEVVTGKALAAHALGERRPYLRTQNVFDGRIDIEDVLTMPMTDEQFAHFRLRSGDVLLNEGQSLELVGRCSLYLDEYPGPCAIQNQLLRFRARKGVSPVFASYLFRNCQQTGIFARIALQTTSIAHLGGSRFERLRLAWPNTEAEQHAIAEVLSDMDAEITMLEQRCDKIRALKQAMMQELLTGKTRLLTRRAAHA